MSSRRNVHYSRLPGEEERDYDGGREKEDDPRFAYTPKTFDKIPWKSIALALFLLFLGVMLLFLSIFIFTGHMGGDKSQAYGLLMLGILTFLPVSNKYNYFLTSRTSVDLDVPNTGFVFLPVRKLYVGPFQAFMRPGLLIIHGGAPKVIDFHQFLNIKGQVSCNLFAKCQPGNSIYLLGPFVLMWRASLYSCEKSSPS